MSMSKYFNILQQLTGHQITRVRLILLCCFSLLIALQLLIGFNSFEDYLVAFVYILFLNDLFIKTKRPDIVFSTEESRMRSVMTFIFFFLFGVTFLLDVFNVNDHTRAFLYRVGFMLWAQIFLLDAFNKYKETNSKNWLFITNLAALFIVLGAIL